MQWRTRSVTGCPFVLQENDRRRRRRVAPMSGRNWRALTTVALIVASNAAHSQTASLIDLGPNVLAYGINASGQITGCFAAAGGTMHAFVRTSGTVADLGTLGGSNSCGYALNASGQITGYAETASGAQHAFLYSAGVMTDLGLVGG